MSSRAAGSSFRGVGPSKERPRRKEPVAIGNVVNAFLKASGITAHVRHLAVFQAWDASLGRESARRARPVAFRSGTLTVEVESAAHLHELQQFTGEQYRTLANARLGTAEIRKVLFRLKR